MGVLWIDVSVTGKPGHTLDTKAGCNAITAAFGLFNAVKDMAETWNKVENRHKVLYLLIFCIVILLATL